jgi:endoglucanase
MAWEFLKTIKAPATVANIVADQTVEGSRAKSQQVTITDFSRKDGLIRFTALEKALPFPLREDQLKGAELVPFAENLNREIVKFNYLTPGNYTLSIDGMEIGRFFSGELERGVNLALLPGAPQYRQALKVQALLQRSWQLEAQLRAMRLIEYRYINTLPGRENLETVRRFYDTAHANKPDSDYVKKMFLTYMNVKPKEAEIRQQWQRSLDSLPVLNKPVPHRYVLKKS